MQVDPAAAGHEDREQERGDTRNKSAAEVIDQFRGALRTLEGGDFPLLGDTRVEAIENRRNGDERARDPGDDQQTGDARGQPSGKPPALPACRHGVELREHWQTPRAPAAVDRQKQVAEMRIERQVALRDPLFRRET